jgi:hypothetical protein
LTTVRATPSPRVVAVVCAAPFAALSPTADEVGAGASGGGTSLDSNGVSRCS